MQQLLQNCTFHYHRHKGISALSVQYQKAHVPLDVAGHAVVATLLGEVGDGLLQAHVEAQALTEVVAHLQEQRHLAAHT